MDSKKQYPGTERRRARRIKVNFKARWEGTWASREGYIADIPDLEACSAFGRTPDEAFAELQIARRAWL